MENITNTDQLKQFIQSFKKIEERIYTIAKTIHIMNGYAKEDECINFTIDDNDMVTVEIERWYIYEIDTTTFPLSYLFDKDFEKKEKAKFEGMKIS